MATTIQPAAPEPALSLAPNWLDKGLAGGTAILLAALVVALVRGRAEWGELAPLIWIHIVAIAVALALTPIMMLRRRGDRLHRRLGWIWLAAMLAAATASLGIRGVNDGALSPIHLFSALTLVLVPLILLHARRHNVAAHRASVRGLMIGGLLIAGPFTFIPGRVLGNWLFG